MFTLPINAEPFDFDAFEAELMADDIFLPISKPIDIPTFPGAQKTLSLPTNSFPEYSELSSYSDYSLLLPTWSSSLPDMMQVPSLTSISPSITPAIPSSPPKSKIYACSYCPKTFSRAYSMKSHEVTHTGSREFVCDCGSAFGRKHDLVCIL